MISAQTIVRTTNADGTTSNKLVLKNGAKKFDLANGRTAIYFTEESRRHGKSIVRGHENTERDIYKSIKKGT